ncbi:hypothetical protein FD754_017847, partial [Muntiacus muntjak]
CGPVECSLPGIWPIFCNYYKWKVTFQNYKNGSISRCRLISELHHHQEWALHSSQANPNPTRANSRILLKQLGKSLLL